MFQSRSSSAVGANHSLRCQRGDMLTEAMIGMLLFAVAGMGISFISSKVAVSQRDAKVQHQVINELRSMVINRADTTELCSNGSSLRTDNFSTRVSVQQGCVATTATVNGVAISNVYAPIVLSATLDAIGEVRVGGYIEQQETN